MMNQPMFTFSPDGVSVYAFTPGPVMLKTLATLFLAFLLMMALALIELAHLFMQACTFLLTSPEATLIRIFAFLIALVLILLIAQRLRSAALNMKAGA